MDWIKPKFSRTVVNKAGEILKEGYALASEWDWAMERLSNLRSSHIYPLTTFNTTLSHSPCCPTIEAGGVYSMKALQRDAYET